MLDKAARGRKPLQMLSDVTNKTYENLKLQTGVGGRRDCHRPATQGRRAKEDLYC